MTVRWIKLLILIAGAVVTQVTWACREEIPRARTFALPQGSCPSGYYRSGSGCVPMGGSSRYGFASSNGSCPSSYYRSGAACLANSDRSCYAFYSEGGSCPSGYYRSGSACLSH